MLYPQKGPKENVHLLIKFCSQALLRGQMGSHQRQGLFCGGISKFPLTSALLPVRLHWSKVLQACFTAFANAVFHPSPPGRGKTCARWQSGSRRQFQRWGRIIPGQGKGRTGAGLVLEEEGLLLPYTNLPSWARQLYTGLLNSWWRPEQTHRAGWVLTWDTLTSPSQHWILSRPGSQAVPGVAKTGLSVKSFSSFCKDIRTALLNFQLIYLSDQYPPFPQWCFSLSPRGEQH